MFLDIPPPGVGFNADDLHKASQRNVTRRLREELPELHGRGVRVLLAHRQATKELEALKRDLLKMLKPDGLKLAIEALSADVDAQLKAEAAKQRMELARSAPQGQSDQPKTAVQSGQRK